MYLWKKLISSVLITVLAVSVITACSSQKAQETPGPKQEALGVQPMMPAIEDICGISSISELSEFICDPMERSMFVPAFFAKVWKLVCTREYEYSCLTQDPHPLHYFRTNVTVQQFDEF